jgi:hypothetical protein
MQKNLAKKIQVNLYDHFFEAFFCVFRMLYELRRSRFCAGVRAVYHSACCLFLGALLILLLWIFVNLIAIRTFWPQDHHVTEFGITVISMACETGFLACCCALYAQYTSISQKMKTDKLTCCGAFLKSEICDCLCVSAVFALFMIVGGALLWSAIALNVYLLQIGILPGSEKDAGNCLVLEICVLIVVFALCAIAFESFIDTKTKVSDTLHEFDLNKMKQSV